MNNGIVSSIVEGRAADFAMMEKSCRQLLNGIPTVYGSVMNRGGSYYKKPVKDELVKTALIPFIVGQRIAYVLEFGNQYMRVYRNGEDDYVFEMETPYLNTDMFDAEGRLLLDYKQSADVIYLAHENYPAAKVMRFADDDWRMSTIKFAGGPWQRMNLDETKRIKAVQQNPGDRIITLSGYTGANPVAEWAGVSVETGGSNWAVVQRFYLGGYNGAGTMVWEESWGGAGGSVPPFSYAELAASVFNSKPQFQATNPTRGSLRLTAIANQATYSGQHCSLYVIRYDQIGNWSYRYNNSDFNVTGAATELFDESWVGRQLRIFQMDTVVQGWRQGLAVSIGTEVRAGPNVYAAQSAGTTGGQMPVHTEGIESDGAVTWKYLHSGYVVVEIIEYIDPETVKARVLGQQVVPSGIFAVGSYQWELSLFGDEEAPGQYPSAVEFYKNRLAFGINAASGPKVVFSVAGDYENFSDLDHGEQLPESAMDLPVFTNLNKIVWLSTLKDLYVGTEGSILTVRPISSGNVFGPDNITYDELVAVGSCKVKPIKFGGDLLYLGPKGKDIYSIQYNFASDSYEPMELSILATEHLEETITSWALQYTPNRVVHAVRGDGKMIGLTYNKTQEVRAFQLYDTEGAYEQVVSIPNIEEGIDEVWYIARRPLEHRYIEKFVDRTHFLDCAEKLEFAQEETDFPVPAHLLGMENLVVVADGKDYYDVEDSGLISLPKGTKEALVGLGYKTILEPQPVNQDRNDQRGNGSGMIRSQRISKIHARLKDTHSFKYGEDINALVIAKVNEPNTPEVLKSGDLELDWPGNNTHQKIKPGKIVNSTGARFIFMQDRPFPVHWSAFLLEISISDD